MNFLEIYGILFDAFGEYKAAKRSGDSDWIFKTKITLRRAITTTIAQFVFNLVLLAIFLWFPIWYAFPDNLIAQIILFVIIYSIPYVGFIGLLVIFIKGIVNMISLSVFGVTEVLWCIVCLSSIIYMMCIMLHYKRKY